MTGGGSAAGQVGFPVYMETKHEEWVDVADALADALAVGGGPYNTAYSYDPDPNLLDMQDVLDDYVGTVADLDEYSDYDSILTAAIAHVDDDIGLDPNGSLVTAAVDAYETQQISTNMRAVNRFTGGMADINAVNGSAFVIGLALIENQLQADVGQFQAQLKLQKDKERNLTILHTAEGITKLLQLKLQSQQGVAASQADISRASIIAKREQLEGDLQIDVENQLWDFGLYQQAGTILGSISGTGMVPRPTPKIQSVLGGALSTGSQFGMLGGQMGGSEGGILGLLMGGLGGGIMGLL